MLIFFAAVYFVAFIFVEQLPFTYYLELTPELQLMSVGFLVIANVWLVGAIVADRVRPVKP